MGPWSTQRGLQSLPDGAAHYWGSVGAITVLIGRCARGVGKVRRPTLYVVGHVLKRRLGELHTIVFRREIRECGTKLRFALQSFSAPASRHRLQHGPIASVMSLSSPTTRSPVTIARRMERRAGLTEMSGEESLPVLHPVHDPHGF
jgi:hypothetical protein